MYINYQQQAYNELKKKPLFNLSLCSSWSFVERCNAYSA